MKNYLYVLTAVSAVGLMSCAITLPPPPALSMTYPRLAAVLTGGVEIRGTDWALKSGDPVPAPFKTQARRIPAGTDPIDLYEEKLKDGAQYCRVVVPQREKPLYGVLSLGAVVANTKESSARRVYRIAVPPARVQSALGGQVSVIYQPYAYTQQVRRTARTGDQFYANAKATGWSWMLWISDAPFPGQKQ